MAHTGQSIAHRVLLVDSDRSARSMMKKALSCKGFEVVTASSVPVALRHIADETFDVLIADLHVPDPGDGFTVVSAMRHSQSNALTLLVSGYTGRRGTATKSAFLFAAEATPA